LAVVARGEHILRCFKRIDLDPVTFQPVGFTWRDPEWRA
jgi:hypothetical protein